MARLVVQYLSSTLLSQAHMASSIDVIYGALMTRSVFVYPAPKKHDC